LLGGFHTGEPGGREPPLKNTFEPPKLIGRGPPLEN